MLTRYFFAVTLILTGTLSAHEAGDVANASGAGDELPDRALGRLGTQRMRHGAAIIGHVLLDGGKTAASTSHDRTVRIWELESGRQLHRHDFDPSESVPTTISVIDDRSFLVSLGSGKSVRFNAEAEPLVELEHPELRYVQAVPGGELFTGVDEAVPGELILFDADANRTGSIDSGAPKVVTWRFSADGSRVALSGWAMKTRHTGTAHLVIAEVATGEVLASVASGEQYIQGLAFSPDAGRVMLGLGDGNVRVFDVAGSTFTPPQKAHISSVLTAAWSPDGKWIATGSGKDRQIAIHDGESGEWIHTFIAHDQSIAALSFTPDSERLVSSSNDSRLRVFIPETGEPTLHVPGHRAAICSVDWSGDGEVVATGGFDSSARLWDPATGQEKFVLDCGAGSVNDIAFSPDDKRIATASQDSVFRVFSVETGELEYAVSDGNYAVFCVRWSPDGKRIATGHGDGGYRIHDAATGRVLLRKAFAQGFCFAIAWSPSGDRLIAASSTIRQWETKEFRELSPLGGPKAPVSALEFDQAGSLWSASADRRVIRWNLETGKSELEFQAHPSRVEALAVSGAGDVIATCGYGEDTIRLWDAKTGEPVDDFVGHPASSTGIAFDPNGGRFATVAMDANGLIWKTR